MDLIFKLIESLIQLARQREESDRKLHQDFVEPSLSDFEKVHQNYIETFKSYRKIITSDSEPMNKAHSVLKQIKEDMLFSAQLREKLKALEEYENDPVIGAFVSSISNYMNYGENNKYVLVEGYRSSPNSARYTVIKGLIEILESADSEEQKREESVSLIDKSVDELQASYGDVTAEYLKLKKKLLDRRLNNK